VFDVGYYFDTLHTRYDIAAK